MKLTQVDFEKFIAYCTDYVKANPNITYKQFCEGLKDAEVHIRKGNPYPKRW